MKHTHQFNIEFTHLYYIFGCEYNSSHISSPRIYMYISTLASGFLIKD